MTRPGGSGARTARESAGFRKVSPSRNRPFFLAESFRFPLLLPVPFFFRRPVRRERTPFPFSLPAFPKAPG